MGMKRFMLSITDEMEQALETERKKRMLGSIPETARVIIGEYFSSDRLTGDEKMKQEIRDAVERKGKHQR